jgi:hypothetical protein
MLLSMCSAMCTDGGQTRSKTIRYLIGGVTHPRGPVDPWEPMGTEMDGFGTLMDGFPITNQLLPLSDSLHGRVNSSRIAVTGNV